MSALAGRAVSEMPPNGSRAAACNWTNDELTKALELVPSALLSLSHQALVSPSGGYGFARSALMRRNLTRTGGQRATLAAAPIGILLFVVIRHLPYFQLFHQRLVKGTKIEILGEGVTLESKGAYRSCAYAN